jgi:hypothetical protein
MIDYLIPYTGAQWAMWFAVILLTLVGIGPTVAIVRYHMSRENSTSFPVTK